MTEFIKSFAEVDKAMYDRLNGFSIEGKPVKLTYYTPDVDLHELNPPAMVLYRTNPFRDLSRWNNDQIFRDNYQTDEDGNPDFTDVRIAPEPWTIMYTVKTLYTLQMDGIELNDYLLRVFTRGDFITIKNVNYDVEQLTAGLWGSQYKDFGRVEDGERKFQETYAFKVDVYLEVDTPTPVKVVQRVEVENIPHQ